MHAIQTLVFASISMLLITVPVRAEGGGDAPRRVLLCADVAMVLWRFRANGGLSDSGGWAALFRDLSSPDTGWGAYMYLTIAVAVFGGFLIGQGGDDAEGRPRAALQGKV